MRRFLMGAAIVAGLVAGGMAQAGDRGRHFDRGSDGRHTEFRHDNDRRDFNRRDFDRHDFDRHDHDRREFYREHGFHFDHGFFFRGEVHPVWTFRCYSPVYRCWFFWYPDLSCYYYWSDASGCWYPMSYMGTVPPSGEFPGMGGVPQTPPAGVALPPGAGVAGPMTAQGAAAPGAPTQVSPVKVP
jgi:hypothetical protein